MDPGALPACPLPRLLVHILTLAKGRTVAQIQKYAKTEIFNAFCSPVLFRGIYRNEMFMDWCKYLDSKMFILTIRKLASS